MPFPITLVQAGGAYDWISSYIYQDAEVQRQFRDRVIVAEDEDGHRRTHTNVLRSSEYVDVKSNAKFETWSRDDVVATIRPMNSTCLDGQPDLRWSGRSGSSHPISKQENMGDSAYLYWHPGEGFTLVNHVSALASIVSA